MIEKHRIASALCLVLIVACTSDEAPNSPDRINDFATRYTAAWNSQDPASVATFFAEDGSLSVNGNPSRGREAIAEVARGFMSAFPDMELLMDRVDTRESLLIYHWTFIGTNSGPGGTGNAVHFSGYEEWTFDDDGLIAKSMGHFDNDEYQRQLAHGANARVAPCLSDPPQLREIVAIYAKATGSQFVLDPRVRAKVNLFGIDVEHIDRTTLLGIFSVHGYAAIESEGITYVVPDAIADSMRETLKANER